MFKSFNRDKDCLKIWESLKHAFIYKNPCNITSEDYEPLMELATHPIPCNKVTDNTQGGLLCSDMTVQCSGWRILSVMTVSVCSSMRMIFCSQAYCSSVVTFGSQWSCSFSVAGNCPCVRLAPNLSTGVVLVKWWRCPCSLSTQHSVRSMLSRL